MKKLLLIMLLLACPCLADGQATYVGWVRSIWTASCGGHYLIVFENENDSSTLTMEFNELPPVWKDEHVAMKLHKYDNGFHSDSHYDIIEVRRLK